MISTAATAVGLFAGTNIDDIIVLTLFFLRVQRGSLQTWHVVAGQFIGVGALIALSLLAAFGLQIVPDRWVGLLGLIPLGLGIRGFIAAMRAQAETEAHDSTMNPGGLPGVIGVTVANGADNIAVYTPVFRTLPGPDVVLTVIVFVLLIGVWIVVGRAIGSRREVLQVISRFERWLVPAVYCALGTFIVVESHVLSNLF